MLHGFGVRREKRDFESIRLIMTSTQRTLATCRQSEFISLTPNSCSNGNWLLKLRKK